jgi:hypothetical protein
LTLAVVAGLAAGLIRAWYLGGQLSPAALRRVWLVPLAFIPQLLVFFLPSTYRYFSDAMASAALISSQLVLLYFAWINRRHAGFVALGIGVALNLLVISLNGGLMPISPETLTALYPVLPEGWSEVGARLGSNKNILLPESATHLAFLADRFLLPVWFPNRVAFSLGDLFIGIGAFSFLWRAADQDQSVEGPSKRRMDTPGKDRTQEPETPHQKSEIQGYLERGTYPVGVSGVAIRRSLHLKHQDR